MSLVIHDARIVTLAGPAPRRGPALGSLGVIPRGHVVVEQGRIVSVAAGPPPAGAGERIDARGRVLVPGFVDCHTHACWAGHRLDEWEQRRRGTPYLDILRSGGGIMSTVRAVRAASEEELADLLLDRLQLMLLEGTTTAEVKSGYGLSTEHELKMLRAIELASERTPMTVVPTACLGHALDPGAPGGRDAFVRRTIEETLPAVHERHPRVAIDAYCEDGAWTLDECARLFEAALALGHPVRVHADQFHALGMTDWAVAHGAASVDHLEVATPESLRTLARSEAFGVMLPGASFHGGGPHANGRAFVDEGGALAIATNWNPGTSPCPSMAFAVALAVRCLGLTPPEALAAATANPAALLGLPERGRIEAGCVADLVLLRHRDERELAFELGARAADLVICGGELLG